MIEAQTAQAEEVAKYFVGLAKEYCITYIASAISKCEFRTTENNIEKFNKRYFILNISPNKRENATQFWCKVVKKLYDDGECIIIPIKNEFYVVDSFEQVKSTTIDCYDTYKNFIVDDIQYNKSLKSIDVLHLRINNSKLSEKLEEITAHYNRLFILAFSGLSKSNGNRYTFNYETIPQNEEELKKFNETYLGDKMMEFVNKDTGVLPLGKGMAFNSLNNPSGATTMGTTRDISSLINDVFDTVMNVFFIPIQLRDSRVEGMENVFKQFITFAVSPIAEQIQQEFNRKTYNNNETPETAFINGTSITVSYTNIMQRDIFEEAVNVDKLIASGVQCVNDILRELGKKPINEEWANKHFITKNYAEVTHELDITNNNEPIKEEEGENA